MPTATTPPLIAPGIVCPKCKGQMLDERKAKRTDKSPDYTCANLTCVQTGANGKTYRTAIWERDVSKPDPRNGVPPFLHNAEAEDNAELAGKIGAPDKPKLTKLYLDATEFVIDKIVPMFEKAEIPLSDTAVIAAVATIFIAASKER